MPFVVAEMAQPANPLRVGVVVVVCLGSRGGQVTAFVLIFACAASAWPVAYYGEAAEDSVMAMADEDGQAWLKAHAHRADDLIWVFYVLALVSASAIFAPRSGRRPRVPWQLRR